MSKAASWVLPVFMAAAMGTILASSRQEPTQTAADRQAISYDKWLAAKENAAFMIIKMHKLDPTVDLAPAKRMLEEGLAIAGTTEECRTLLTMDMEYIKLFFRFPE